MKKILLLTSLILLNTLSPGQRKIPAGGTAGQILKIKPDGYNLAWYNLSTTTTWGSITGTLSSQSDLQNTLNAKLSFVDTTKYTSLHGNAWQNGMFLGTSNNRSLRFRTNGLQRMVLDSNGKVGIGTTTPTYKLDVFGTASADMINSKVGYNITTVTKPDITSMTATPVAGSGLEIGYNYYHVTYYNAIGETEASNLVTAITTAGNQQVNLANIPISSDPTVIGRKIYRSKVSEGSSYGFNIATIADNTTTTYSDNFPESSMTGDIYSRSIYAKANTTSKFIALNGTRSMVIDANFTSIGVNAGQNITVGAGNTFFGARTGQNVTYGGGNTFFGKYAGQLITTGSDNNFFGNEAGANTGTGVSFSVGIGASALKHATGSTNNAIGYYNGYNTSGGYNNFIGGYTANGSPLSGSNNNGIGHFGMTASTSAHDNNFFGYMALMNLTTGDGNIAIGHQAGDNITTGSKNIIIGYDIDAPSATTDGQMSIGNLIYATGIDGTGTTVSSGNVGIGAIPVTSSLLELKSTSKGFLPPRMTGLQAENITSPAEGLMIYATDGSGSVITSKGWWGYDGSSWVKLN